MKLRAYAFALLPLLFFPALAAEELSFSEAIAGGDATLSFRYRFEFVDQDSIAKEAKASTLRSRLSYKTASWSDFSAVLEMDNIASIGPDDYNSSRNGKTTYPVVADPTGTSVNEAYIQFAGMENTVLKYGRQRINLDGQRFVGGVGWRQNEQTFSGLRAVNKSVSDLELNYIYISDVSRIFGPDDGAPGTPVRSFDSNSHLVHAVYSGLPAGRLSAYGYFLDLELAPALSSRTFGLRFAGASDLSGETRLKYTLEFARQSDYKDNPGNYSENYFLGELGVEVGHYSIMLGYESLGGQNGDPGMSFQTPLATLHIFQGWADKFLSNPAGGVTDSYLSFGARLGDYKAALVYHQFDQEDGSLDYGDEWDFSISRKFAGGYGTLLKFASYSADALATDTTKIWLMFSASY
ncbi:MAG: hypothetical protein IIB68_00070 [Proteobacteria bacterium]|nr:hypothetical protein [Pseudomonadota bacterium]